MDGRVGGQEGPEPAYGRDRVVIQAQHVADEALVELDAGRIDGARWKDWNFRSLKSRQIAWASSSCHASSLRTSRVVRVSSIPLLPVPLPSCALLEWLACSSIPSVELHHRARAISRRDPTKGSGSCTCNVNHARTPSARVPVRVAIMRCALYRTSRVI